MNEGQGKDGRANEGGNPAAAAVNLIKVAVMLN